VQNEPNLALPQVGDGGDCAKRTQFRSAQGVRRRPNVQNEPNWAPPQVGDGGDCAKRTQFAPAAGRQEFSLKAFALMMADGRLMMEMGDSGEELPRKMGHRARWVVDWMVLGGYNMRNWAECDLWAGWPLGGVNWEVRTDIHGDSGGLMSRAGRGGGHGPDSPGRNRSFARGFFLQTPCIFKRGFR
jgi:hypothetical protein